jgi:hypothetical protein
MLGDEIQKLLHAQPFRAFRVHVSDGRALEVPHPDFALLTRGHEMLVIDTEDDGLEMVNVEQIARFTIRRRKPKSKYASKRKSSDQ